MFSRIQANTFPCKATPPPRLGPSSSQVSSQASGSGHRSHPSQECPACPPTAVPTWPQLLEVHQHPVGRTGIDAQGGGALKRDVTRNRDERFLAEHSLGPPGS